MYSVYLSFKFTYSFKVSFSAFIISNSLNDCSNWLFSSFSASFSSFKVDMSEKNASFPVILFFKYVIPFCTGITKELNAPPICEKFSISMLETTTIVIKIITVTITPIIPVFLFLYISISSCY